VNGKNIMKQLKALVLTCVVAGASLCSAYAVAHPRVQVSVPGADTTVAAPKEIVVTFTEPVEESFSKMTLTAATGKEVGVGKLTIDAANPATLHLEVPSLAAGKYALQWIAVARNGHRTNGEFSFLVK
jgi:methionine-rich copper-binding protein CopC